MKDTNIIIKAAALVTLSLSALPCVAAATTPSVTVIQPTSSVADVMEIQVKATDPDGISKVKLYIDGVQLAGDTKAPYNFIWDSYSYKGRDVKIKALAIDTKNSKGTDEITFAVPKSNTSNPSPPDEETPDTGTQPSKGKTEILFTGDFETGAIQARPEDHDGWSEQSGGLAKGIVVQSAIKRAGKYAAKSTLNKGDWDGTNTIQGKTKPRAKLAKSNAYVPFQFDNEYWIGISTYIPKNWVNETNINNVEVLWQLHAAGDVGANLPPLVLHAKNGRLYIRNRSGEIYTDLQSRTIWEGDIEKGKWVDWVVRVKFSLSNQGYVQVWKNGKKVGDFSGPTMFYEAKNSKRDPLYFTAGLYKPKFVKQATAVTSHTMYFDEVRIAKGANNMDNVSP